MQPAPCGSFPGMLPIHQQQGAPLRRGKWTSEEEAYASQIIHCFSSGTLDAAPGATLRNCLAERLRCDPMRITKKYSGGSSLGKKVYMASKHATKDEVDEDKKKLGYAEVEWKSRVSETEADLQSKVSEESLLFGFVGGRLLSFF